MRMQRFPALRVANKTTKSAKQEMSAKGVTTDWDDYSV